MPDLNVSRSQPASAPPHPVISTGADSLIVRAAERSAVPSRHDPQPALTTEGARLQPCHTKPRLSAASKRLLQFTAIFLVAFTMLGAGNPSTRFDKLGHKLMCPCGCAEILLECNHVGCPDSNRMIGELHTELATTLPDNGVLNWFANKYGPTVLASPMRGGFDLVAWIVPFAVLILGIVGIIWLVRHWRDRQARAALAAPGGPSSPYVPPDDLRDRIRRETTFEP